MLKNKPALNFFSRNKSSFREEGTEAKHHEVNGINRVMACMRREEERLAMCLKRVEVRQAQKAGNLAVPVPRTVAKKD